MGPVDVTVMIPEPVLPLHRHDLYIQPVVDELEAVQLDAARSARRGSAPVHEEEVDLVRGVVDEGHPAKRSRAPTRSPGEPATVAVVPPGIPTSPPHSMVQ